MSAKQSTSGTKARSQMASVAAAAISAAGNSYESIKIAWDFWSVYGVFFPSVTISIRLLT